MSSTKPGAMTPEQGQRRESSFTTVDGRRLRDLRSQRGLSRRDLARLAGISPHTLARLERQDNAPCRRGTVTLLAIALGEHRTTLT